MAGSDLIFETSTAFPPVPNAPVILRKSIDQEGWSYLTLDDMGAVVNNPDAIIPADPQKVGVVRLSQKWVSDNAAKARMQVRRKVNGMPADPETDPELVRIWNASKPKKLFTRILADLYGPGKGNALLRKIRDPRSKRVLSLEPIDMREVIRDPKLKVWAFRAEGLVRENLVWFSLGSRPDDWEAGENQWIGFEDDLRTLREEAAYCADVLTNAGVIGLVISKDDQTSTFSPHAIRKMQKDGKAMTTRGKRGSVLVSGTGMKVNEVGQGPDRLAIDRLPRGAQARVSANLNVALMVLGLPDPNKTYSNLEQATKGSLRSAVVPFHDLIAETLANDLLADTGLSSELYEVYFDYSDLEEFREDVDAMHDRIRKDVAAGLITPNEGRARLGMEESDDPEANRLRGSVDPLTRGV
jgi:hypothetical protein